MATDYVHPPDWDSYTPEEKHEWYCEWRAMKQAMNQTTVWETSMDEYIEEQLSLRDRILGLVERTSSRFQIK